MIRRTRASVSLLELLPSFPTMTLSRTRTLELETPKKEVEAGHDDDDNQSNEDDALSTSWMDEN